MEGYHASVLLREAVEALGPRRGPNIRDAWYLDCTLGDGGHTKEILKRGGKAVAIDVDPQALERAQRRFREAGISQTRFKLIQGNFRDIKNLIQSHCAEASRDEQTDTAGQKFAGAIFDLGVSSLQLETPQRGFSFAKVGPLDMRMDPELKVTALDLLNALTGKELNELFKNLGEEKYSKRMAEFVVRAREVNPFSTTVELANIIAGAAGRFGKRAKIHPATKVFQALRVAVNDELGALKEGLSQVKDLIQKNGRIVVISFHSLEDRIVKNLFREWESLGLGEVITKKPVVPKEAEIAANPRSRSAKMRVFEII